MELAASFHELSSAATRLAAEGGDATTRDVEVAVAAADGLEQHVLSNPYEARLEDPVLTPRDETLIPPPPEDPEPVHAVPTFARVRSPLPWVVGAAGVAIAVLLAVLLLRGRRPDPLREATTAYSNGDTARAFAFFLDAAKAHPKSPEPHYYMAQIYRLKGRPQEAARELREGLQIAPEHSGLNTELGFLMLGQGRTQQAAERFAAAVKADTANARAWAGLVSALRRSGRGVQAERLLARAPVEVRSLITTVRADTATYVPPPAPVPAPGTVAAPGTVPAPAGTYPPDTTGTVAAPLQP